MNLKKNQAMSDQFRQLMDTYWEYRKDISPMTSTRSGDHSRNDRLDETSDLHMEERKARYAEFLQQLRAIDPQGFEEADRLNYQILEQRLSLDIQRIGYKMYRSPLSTMGGIHNWFPRLGMFVPLKTEKDYENLLSRYAQMPRSFDQNMELMRTGLKEGQVPPQITLSGVDVSIQTQLDTPIDDSPYMKPFQKFPDHFSADLQNDLQGRALEIVTDQIFPKLEEFRKFVKEEYEPHCREKVGASEFDNGQEYYQHCITYFTSLTLTAQEIHDIGLSEVKRIREEMEAIRKQVDFQGDLQAFFEYLRTDPQFYPQNKEQLMERTAFVLKKIDGKLPEIFKTLPRLPYGIKEIPDYQAPNSTTAYYMPGAGDGTRSGTYYVNTYDLKSRPLYEVEALSLHEAVPGHHLQLALQQEIEIPTFRKYSSYTSFVEGWGLYSERLGLETGFYEDPYSNFGRLSYEMWRACRLVVDTGMHALGWSRQQAIDFMADNSSLTLLNITNEVDRYIGWPGQAVAYKLGELKIRELRKRAEDALGSKFDIREFHDAVLLDGSIPLSVLEDKIDRWIATQIQN